MSIQLTPEQRAVVEDRGGSLLVSAAAGSGKTKVLVERLFRRVLGEERADLTDFLIITYTRAAAAELRERIAQELSVRLAEDPGDRHLQRQLLLVYRADIKTVDAFCTALLRENVHLLEIPGERGLTADFRVLDEAEAMLLRRRVLPRVLEDFYAGLTPGGALLADSFGFGRDDRDLEGLVLELYDKVQSHPYPEKWLEEQKAAWSALPGNVGGTDWGRELLDGLARKARHWAALLEAGRREMEEDAGLERAYGDAFSEGKRLMDALAEAAGTGWDEAAERVPAWPRLNAARNCQSPGLKDRLQKLWARCKKEMAAACAMLDVPAAEAAEDLRRSAPAMEALLDLCAAFAQEYRREKLRRNAADFSDQEHYAIRLLLNGDGGYTELAETVSRRYREVMVDEYQDTNQVQNCVFDAVSHGGRTLFTVGDAKQSIYRFRLADPTIFLEKYAAYPDGAEAADGQPRKLLLSRNFRSRAPVLDAANFVFANIMSRDMGELDYGPAERLYFGADYLPPRDGCRTEFHLLRVPMNKAGEPRVSRPLAEARFVAERIAALLAEGFPVTDGDTGALRPCRPSDIAVLMRSPTPRLPHYTRALAERGIPCGVQENDDFFSSMEVAVVLSLLELLDNPRQDIPLISVLRSPVFGFSPDRLARIRGGHPEGCFYDAVEASEDDDCRAFVQKLTDLRSLARDMSVHRLLWRLYNELNILGVFGAMAGGERRRENLMVFCEQARSFESAGYKGLFAFVSHLRFMLENGEQPHTASGDLSGGVQIMSIHRSKGLEFPIVILADLNKNFNTEDLKKPVLVHPKLGLGPQYIDLDRRIRYPTAARDAVAARLSRELRSEELRVLYVGMTRAKEKLILVASLSAAEDAAARKLSELTALSALPVPPETVDGAKSMAEWVMLPLLRRLEAEPLRAAAGQTVDCELPEDEPWIVRYHDGAAYTAPPAERIGTALPEERAPALPVDREALDFVYPHALAAAVPTKLTATQLKGREKDREIAEDTRQPYVRKAFAAPRFLSGERPVAPEERGTAMHLVLQHLGLDGDPAAVTADLVRRRLLTPEQGASVDLAALRRYLASPLAAELRQADKVEREFRFSLLVPAGTYFPGLDAPDEIMLQGVVDLFSVKDSSITVVDFKTDRVTGKQVSQRAEEYRPQLMAYTAALEQIMGMPVARRVVYFLHCGVAVEL